MLIYGDVLDAVLRELGMPRSLREVGIGKEQLEKLAPNALQDPWSEANPVSLRTKERVLEILEDCARGLCTQGSFSLNVGLTYYFDGEIQRVDLLDFLFLF